MYAAMECAASTIRVKRSSLVEGNQANKQTKLQQNSPGSGLCFLGHSELPLTDPVNFF